MAEIRKFLMKGACTGKLATVRKEGRSHVIPLWFALFSDKKPLTVSVVS